MITLILAGLATFSAASLAVEPNSVVHDFDRYASLYPVHVEYCAGTQFQFIGGVGGGRGGHGFTYVHGLCKDDSVNYPRVKPCAGNESHRGVGVSVNSDFLNVNWVAVPTHSLTVDGDIRQGEKITMASVDRVSKEAVGYRIFENVRIKPELTKDAQGRQIPFATDAYLRAVAKNSQGTDLAIRYARNLDCVRVPIRSESLEKIASYLNGLNALYYNTGKTYAWDGLANNCAHVASGILAAAGIRDAIPAGRKQLASALDPALPRNGLYTLIDIGLMRSAAPWKVYGRKEDRARIMSEEQWMPTQVGVLVKKYPAYQDNEVFKLAGWILPRNGHIFSASGYAFDKKKYTDIGANLLAWEKTYMDQINITRAEWNPFDNAAWELQSDFVYGSKGYNEFEPFYDEYLSDKISEVQTNLTKLRIKGFSNLL